MTEYCFKIKFETPFILGENQERNLFHAHLVFNQSISELRIYFDPKDVYFDHIFFNWMKSINYSKIGKHFKVIDINEDDLLGLDFSEANVIGSTSGGNQYLKTEKYISVEVDWVKLYWKPNEEKLNTGEFYLNNNGFDLVSEYYSGLIQDVDNSFSYRRKNNVSHQIGKVTFNPEFNFYSKDSKRKEVSSIVKEPKFQFNFPSDISEAEIISTFKLLSLASSFYCKRTIDFTTARIRLSDNTIVTKKKNFDIFNEKDKSTLWPIYYVHDIDRFFSKIKTTTIQKDYLKKLELIVRKFNQSIIVDVRSSILLRFAILEICKSAIKISKPEQFTFIENNKEMPVKQRNIFLDEVRDLIVTKINEPEQKEFIKKWPSSIDKIIFKPMRSPFIVYLESLGFKPENFDVEFPKIKGIRDAITHGSTEKYTEDELRECNWMLYRITIGLILKQLEVENWTEDLKMDISTAN